MKDLSRLVELADLELARGRLNDWSHSGLPGGSSEIPGRDSSPSDPVPAMAQVMAGLAARRPNLVREFNKAAGELQAELVAALRSPKPTRDERLGTHLPVTTPAGAGTCDVCGKEVPGGDRASDRIRDRLCSTHHRGMLRAQVRGQTRQGYIDSTRAMLGLTPSSLQE